MKKTLIFITALVNCTAVMAAETPQPQWQPAQSLSTTPTTALPPAPAPVTVAQPAVTSQAPAGVPAPESAATGSAPPAPVPPDAALQYAENVTAPPVSGGDKTAPFRTGWRSAQLRNGPCHRRAPDTLSDSEARTRVIPADGTGFTQLPRRGEFHRPDRRAVADSGPAGER